MVSLLHLAAVFLLTVGIGRPSANATRYKQSRLSVTMYCARPTKRVIHSHGRPWIMCMTARLDVTPKTTEHNRRTVRTGKSEAEVTINKKYARGIVLLKLSTDTKHRAASVLCVTIVFIFCVFARIDRKSLSHVLNKERVCLRKNKFIFKKIFLLSDKLISSMIIMTYTRYYFYYYVGYHLVVVGNLSRFIETFTY